MAGWTGCGSTEEEVKDSFFIVLIPWVENKDLWSTVWGWFDFENDNYKHTR